MDVASTVVATGDAISLPPAVPLHTLNATSAPASMNVVTRPVTVTTLPTVAAEMASGSGVGQPDQRTTTGIERGPRT